MKLIFKLWFITFICSIIMFSIIYKESDRERDNRIRTEIIEKIKMAKSHESS